MNEIIQLNSVDVYNKMYGLKTLHPLVSVVDLRKATRVVNHVKMNYGVYALFLKNGTNCTLKYGRRYYDYQEGTIVSFAPGQLVGVDSDEDEISPEVYGLIFHPDLIYGTALGKKIGKYSFFSYEQNEALHLSDQEREIIMDCFHKIEAELEHNIDKHTRRLITANIGLLLDYCMRFYERQFTTREASNKDVVVRFERLLDEYFDGKAPQENGLPSVKYFADKVFLSPNYFGDMISKQTGKTVTEYIQDKLIGRAKELLLSTSKPMSEIAYSLGFQYPQHMSRMFKRIVGITPNEFRIQGA